MSCAPDLEDSVHKILLVAVLVIGLLGLWVLFMVPQGEGAASRPGSADHIEQGRGPSAPPSSSPQEERTQWAGPRQDWESRNQRTPLEGIVGFQGVPVEGVRVSMRTEAEEVEAVSDEQGRFALHVLRPGELHEIFASKQTVTGTLAAFARTSRADWPLVLELESRMGLQGTVISYESGTPLPAANIDFRLLVSFEQSVRWAETPLAIQTSSDGDGRFFIPDALARGERDRAVLLVTLPGREPTLVRLFDLEQADPTGPFQVVVAMRADPVWILRFRSAFGEPIANRPVWIQCQSVWFELRTDPSGALVMRAPFLPYAEDARAEALSGGLIEARVDMGDGWVWSSTCGSSPVVTDHEILFDVVTPIIQVFSEGTIPDGGALEVRTIPAGQRWRSSGAPEHPWLRGREWQRLDVAGRATLDRGMTGDRLAVEARLNPGGYWLGTYPVSDAQAFIRVRNLSVVELHLDRDGTSADLMGLGSEIEVWPFVHPERFVALAAPAGSATVCLPAGRAMASLRLVDGTRLPLEDPEGNVEFLLQSPRTILRLHCRPRVLYTYRFDVRGAPPVGAKVAVWPATGATGDPCFIRRIGASGEVQFQLREDLPYLWQVWPVSNWLEHHLGGRVVPIGTMPRPLPLSDLPGVFDLGFGECVVDVRSFQGPIQMTIKPAIVGDPQGPPWVFSETAELSSAGGTTEERFWLSAGRYVFRIAGRGFVGEVEMDVEDHGTIKLTKDSLESK